MGLCRGINKALTGSQESERSVQEAAKTRVHTLGKLHYSQVVGGIDLADR